MTLAGTTLSTAALVWDNASSAAFIVAPTSPPYPPPTDEDFDAVRYFKFYSLGIIIPVGFIFNALSIIVFLLSPLRKTTTGMYLVALSFSDSTYLLGELLFWLNMPSSKGPIIGVTFQHKTEFVCKIVYFIRYLGILLSSWLTVTITLERFMTIYFPLRITRLSTTFKAKIAILVQIVVCAGLSSFTFYTIGLRKFRKTDKCQILKVHEDAYKVWNWISLRAGSLIIPSFLVFTFTGLIIYRLVRTRKWRINAMEGQNSRACNRNSQEKQLTIMLLLVAIAFFAIRLPYTVMYYIHLSKFTIWPHLKNHPWASYRIYVAYTATNVFAIINYAINFFLYCLSGSLFRKQFRNVFCKPTNTDSHSRATSISYMSVDRNISIKHNHHHSPNTKV